MQDIQPIYKWIIDSVIAKARPAFLQEGVDEAVLEDLQARWEQKLIDSGVYNAAAGEVEEAQEDAKDKGAEEEEAVADADGQEQRGAQKRDAAAAGLADDQNNEAAKRQALSKDGQQEGVTGGDADGDEAKLDNDSDDDADDEHIQNMVLAQYDKVTRSKNKWKCMMKHGIVHIDGREYVFSKATGEFVF